MEDRYEEAMLVDVVQHLQSKPKMESTSEERSDRMAFPAATESASRLKVMTKAGPLLASHSADPA